MRWQGQDRTPDIDAQLVQLDHTRGRPEPIGIGQCLPVGRGFVGRREPPTKTPKLILAHVGGDGQ